MKNCDLNIFDVMEYKKLKELYVNSGWCRMADLYRDNEGNLVVFWQWMEAHGVGQDHYSVIVESIKDLKSVLRKDLEGGLLTQDRFDRVIEECREFFSK